MSQDTFDETYPVPQHIAIIMDGNGRWAKARGKDRSYGHAMGVESVRKILQHASKRGVEVLTLYTFSEENWHRPQEEVMALMSLLVSSLREEADALFENSVQLRTIGNVSKLPEDAQNLIREVEEQTAENKGIVLQLALSYSSKQEIVHACREMIREGLRPEQVNEETLTRHLYTEGLSDPDLIVRTGGEQRLSNFLLWQGAYSELYFCNEAWPDFDEAALDRAIASYQCRERRYGKTSEQVVNDNETPDDKHR